MALLLTTNCPITHPIITQAISSIGITRASWYCNLTGLDLNPTTASQVVYLASSQPQSQVNPIDICDSDDSDYESNASALHYPSWFKKPQDICDSDDSDYDDDDSGVDWNTRSVACVVDAHADVSRLVSSDVLGFYSLYKCGHCYNTSYYISHHANIQSCLICSTCIMSDVCTIALDVFWITNQFYVPAVRLSWLTRSYQSGTLVTTNPINLNDCCYLLGTDHVWYKLEWISNSFVITENLLEMFGVNVIASVMKLAKSIVIKTSRTTLTLEHNQISWDQLTEVYQLTRTCKAIPISHRFHLHVDSDASCIVDTSSHQSISLIKSYHDLIKTGLT